MEENLKDRLEKEFDYAKEKHRKISNDIDIMLDGFGKDCFEPVCNIEILEDVRTSYLGLALELKRALIDIEQKENEDGK